MRNSRPLPPHLASAFTVADAALAGLGQSRLRASDLQRPFHGVRSQGLDLSSLDGRCHAYAARMHPENVFSHSTAAALWGMPFALADSAHPELHVASSAPRRAPEGVGVVGHQVRFDAGDIRELRGIRVVAPALAWTQVAGTVPDADLVALAEFAVTGLPFRGIKPCATLEELQVAHRSRPKTRGYAQRGRVLPLLRVGPFSRPETLLRLLLCGVGLPEPLINDERIEPTPDLAWPEFMVCVEYEGDRHRGVRQFRYDIHRIERLADVGWTVVKVSADDLYDRPRETAARVAQRLAAKGWRGRADLRRTAQFSR